MNSRLTLFCFLFQAGCVFSQTQLYRSEQAGHSETEKNVYNSITLVGNAVIVNTSNYRLKALNKDNYQELWDIDVGTASNTSPYFYLDPETMKISDMSQSLSAIMCTCDE